MRILLLVLLALTSGCAAVDFGGGPDLPEVSSALRQYETNQDEAQIQPLGLGNRPAAQACTLNGQPAACYSEAQLNDLEHFFIAAHANTQALHAMIRAYAAQNTELAEILTAGQSREAQAELYRALYLAEKSHSRLRTIATAAGGGLLLLIFGAAAL